MLADVIRSHHPNPDEAALVNERRQRMRQAVDQLPEILRSALQLVHFQGLKYREAAKTLNIPEGTVKSRVHQAMRNLDQLLRRRNVVQVSSEKGSASRK